MKSKIIITCVITALICTAGSALATSMVKRGNITCPECGAEITLEKPKMGERKGMKPNFEEELNKKVENGEITQEEADKLKAEFEENMKNRPQRPNFEEELNKKVENGEITQEEADKLKAEFEENMKNRPRGKGGFGRRNFQKENENTNE